MSGLVLAASAAQLGLAAVFVTAALSKVHTLAALRTTLRGLGLPESLSLAIAIAVVITEFAAGAGLLIVPASPWPRAMVALLALGFAGAAAAALTTGRELRCACFGPSSAARLGWRQIGMLPVYLALCGVAQAGPPQWGYQPGLIGLALIVSGLLAWNVRRFRHGFNEVRADRLALGDLEREWSTMDGAMQR